MVLKFTGERIVPGADNCEPTFAQKMYQEHIARYAFAAQFADGRDVLDVGCGVGYGSQWLARAGAKSVLGIDLAEDAIEHARKNYFHPVVTYRMLNAAEIDVEDNVDVAVCFELIEHVRDQVRVLDGIRRALRRDGALIISTPRPLEEMRTHFHEHELNFEEIRTLLKQRFQYVEAFFERNYFTSFVGASEPQSVDQIVSITNRYNIEHADYFIFIASNEKPERFAQARNLLSVNDDSYVLRLEDDMAAMRNGENYHLGLIKDLETRVEGESQARTSAESRALEAQQRAESIEQIRSETGAIREGVGTLLSSISTIAAADQVASLAGLQRDLARLNEELTLLRGEWATMAEKLEVERARVRVLEAELVVMAPLDELAAARDQIEEGKAAVFSMRNERDMLQAEVEQLRLMKEEFEESRNALADKSGKLFELEALTHVLSEQNEGLHGELGRVREAHGANSSRLAEAETEIFFLRHENGELRESAARANGLASELNALRSRLDYAEATLVRFRGSVSWAVTRPLRWTGRTYKKLIGRGA